MLSQFSIHCRPQIIPPLCCLCFPYPLDHKGYRCYNPLTRRVITSRHVIFDESVFPFAESSPPTDVTFLDFFHDLTDMSTRTNSLSSTTGTPEDISIPAADDPVPLLARVLLTPLGARPRHQHPLHHARHPRRHVQPRLRTRLLRWSTVCTRRPLATTPAPPRLHCRLCIT